MFFFIKNVSFLTLSKKENYIQFLIYAISKTNLFSWKLKKKIYS